MHAKYEVSISYGSKIIAKVKVDNRQTNKQTDKQTNRQTGQDKNNMPPIIRSGGITIYYRMLFPDIRIRRQPGIGLNVTYNCRGYDDTIIMIDTSVLSSTG